MKKRVLKIVEISLVVFLCFSSLAFADIFAVTSIKAKNGIVATQHKLASQAALEVLKKGGNAIDAMATGQFVLNVVEPYGSGIGGGCFILLYLADRGEVVVIDGREEAPEAFREDIFIDPKTGEKIEFRPNRITGGNPVGVPGTLYAMNKALEKYGTITLAEAFQPAIKIAEEGFIVSETFANILRKEKNNERLAMFPASAKLFLKADGTPLEAGDALVQKDLAKTFKLIAEKGIGVFYKGEIADDIVNTVRNAPYNPGVMTKKDIELYRAPMRKPVTSTYRGYEVYGMGPPSSGGLTLIEMLNILDAYDLSMTDFASVDKIHLFAEAGKLAYADRAKYMADADFVKVPVDGLTSKAFANKRRLNIDPLKAMKPKVPAGTPGKKGSARLSPQWNDTENICTSHISIIDKDRNMVACTTTIEQFFASAMVVPGRGFLLNNELTDFAAEPKDKEGNIVANRPQGGKCPRRTSIDIARTKGGKRPRSSMSPTLVLKDGKPFLTIGSPGGSLIINYVAWTLINIIDHGMDVQQAINAPRAINSNTPTELEDRLFENEELRKALEAKGHKVKARKEKALLGCVQAVMVDPKTGDLVGGADARREACAVGY